MSGSARPGIGNNISQHQHGSENAAERHGGEEQFATLAGVKSDGGERVEPSSASTGAAAADDSSPPSPSTNAAIAATGGEDDVVPNDGLNGEPTKLAGRAVTTRDGNDEEDALPASDGGREEMTSAAAAGGGKRKKEGSGEGTKKRAKKKPSSSSRSAARAKARANAEKNKAEAEAEANAESDKAKAKARAKDDDEANGVDERNHRDFRGGAEKWNAMLFQLLLYKAKHGDVHVRYDYTDKPLVNWCHQQRIHYKRFQEGKKSHLTEERISVLSATGFLFKQRGEPFWQKNYAKLVQFKHENGHCLVPRESGPLGEWVTDQRRNHKYLAKGKPSTLTPERIRKLDEIGFTWVIRPRTSWDTRYEELLAFREQHGHVVVPQHYSENRQLGKWVAKQREQFRAFRAGKKEAYIKREQIEKLQALGFIWNAKGRSNIHSGDIAL